MTKDKFEELSDSKRMSDYFRTAIRNPLPSNEDDIQANNLKKELLKQEARLGGRIKMHGFEERMKIAIDLILCSIVDYWNEKAKSNVLTYEAEKELWTYNVQKRPDYVLIRNT